MSLLNDTWFRIIVFQGWGTYNRLYKTFFIPLSQCFANHTAWRPNLSLYLFGTFDGNPAMPFIYEFSLAALMLQWQRWVAATEIECLAKTKGFPDVRVIWLRHWLPGLIWLIWLARWVFLSSLTAPCASLPNLRARWKRMAIPYGGTTVLWSGYTSSCTALPEPPNKLPK